MTQTQTILAIFFVQAVAGGGLFARIPDIQTKLALSESVLGMALTGGMVGGLIANLFAGKIVARFGTWVLLAWGIPILSLINAAVALSPTPLILALVVFISGVAFSVTNVAMNIEANEIEDTLKTPVMNRCHGLWSIGMLLAAGIGTVARSAGIPPELHLITAALIVSVVSVMLTARFQSAFTKDPVGQAPVKIALPSKRTFLMVAFAISASVGQMASQNWSVIYMRDTFDVSTWIESLALPSYLGAMAIGRVLADGWIKKVGAAKIALWLSSLGVISALMISITPVAGFAVLGFAFLGIGSAVHFPLMITNAARKGGRPPAEAVSAAIFLSGLAMMATPGLMGWIAELWGLRVAFGALVVPFALSILLVRPVFAPKP